jgi:FKBP-type peptidyl-prolyl cis-trans isomerase FkpA
MFVFLQRKIIMKKLFVFIIPVLFVFSCSDDEYLTYEEQLAKDIKKIEKYLDENDLVATKRSSGLFYSIDQEGNGHFPTASSLVKVTYTGKLLNGEVFDSGTATFSLTSVISGWREGILLFSIGGKGKLFVPSGLGYGIYKSGTIPANSVLVFDIELVNIF